MTSSTSQERTSAALATIPDQESLTAVFVSQEGALATVIQGTSTLQCRSSAQYPAIPGDPVRLERRNGGLVMTGPTSPRSATGRISATGAPRCTVEYPSGSGVEMQMPYSASYTPAVNDIVQISWDALGGSVLFKLTALPSSTAPPSPPVLGPQDHTQRFGAIDSGSFGNGGWKQRDVYASDNFVGAWFYGTTIKDTIPDDAVIKSARLYLPAKQNLYAMPNLGWHAAANKPADGLIINGPVPLTGRSGWVDIPLGLVDVLKTIDSGLGFYRGGYNIFTGTAVDGLSGALDITYNA